MRWIASLALAKIAAALREAGRTDAITVLRDARHAIEDSADPRVRRQAPDLADAVDALEARRPARER